jgi:AsmA-like C-terminal region
VAPDVGGLKITDVVGDHDGLALGGEVNVAADGTFAADFNVGDIALTRVLALAFSPWVGGEFDLARSFAGPDALLAQGEIWLRPRSLEMPYGNAVTEAVLGISLGSTRKLELVTPTNPDVGFVVEVAPKDGSFVASARGKMPVDLARIFVSSQNESLGSGKVLISGDVRGEGRSPSAALAAMEGRGAFTLSNLGFFKIAPDEFARRLPDVKTSADLSAALAAFEASGGLAIESAGGTFDVSKGLLTATPARVSGPGTLSSVSASADFTQRTIEVKTAVSLVGKPDLPDISIIYSGEPGALEKRASTSALAAKLGHELLARDLEELERLKSEQEKLAVAEEQQRQQDQAKFEAYQAQRAELRMRQRELKIHATARKAKRVLAEAEFAAFVQEGDAMNRIDLVRRKLGLSVKPKIAAWVAEAEAKKRAEEERQRKLEEQRKREEEARLKKIEEEKARAEALRLKAIADEQARIEAARLKAEEDARKAEEARLKAEADAKALAEETARAEAERQRVAAEEQRKREEEMKRKLEEVERLRLEEEAKAKLEELPKIVPVQPAPVLAPKPTPACANPLYC